MAHATTCMQYLALNNHKLVLIDVKYFAPLFYTKPFKEQVVDI